MRQLQIYLDLGWSANEKDSLVCRYCCFLMSCVFLGGPIAQANAIAKPNSSTSQFGKCLVIVIQYFLSQYLLGCCFGEYLFEFISYIYYNVADFNVFCVLPKM